MTSEDRLHEEAERIAVPQLDLVGSPVDSLDERVAAAERHPEGQWEGAAGEHTGGTPSQSDGEDRT
jgi:hypothetical protein